MFETNPDSDFDCDCKKNYISCKAPGASMRARGGMGIFTRKVIACRYFRAATLILYTNITGVYIILNLPIA